MTHSHQSTQGRSTRGLVTAALVAAVVLATAGGALAGLISSLGVAKRTVGGRTASIVVDRQGDAVYELSGESLAKLKCVTPDCLKVWSPVRVRSATTRVPIAPRVPGPVAVFHRVKANLYQVMLGGHPLYFYSGDAIGQAKGQGITSFGGTWHVVTAR